MGPVGDALMPLPNWLPELLVVSPWTDGTDDMLYSVFVRDFKGAPLRLDGQRVHYFLDLEDDGREKIFWHLIERDNKIEGGRIPDFARCARLAWPAAIITNANQDEVTRWDYRESRGHTNTYLWLRDQEYVVILRKFESGTRRLVTAHCVDGQGTVRTLESKFKRRLV
jgi:hypothetical protein